MNNKLLFGTNNLHKLREIREMVGEKFDILQLNDLGKSIEVEETEDTLKGNALLKATAFFEESKIPCFADDTGLEVDALNGAPGVHTARYAGDHCNPKDNIEKLLLELGDEVDRSARFKTVIAFFNGEGVWTFEGIAEGRIAHHPRGDQGFGYDPVFIPMGYTQTFAEMDATLKHAISHRGKAVRAFAEFLKRL